MRSVCLKHLRTQTLITVGDCLKMNNKAITLSVVMAVIAMMFVESYVSSIEDKAKKEYGTEILVVTASKDIQEMQSINETMLSLKTVPKKFLEPAAISFTGDAKKAESDLKDLAGTVAIVPIRKGEQLTFNKLTEPSIRTGLSHQVKPGYRAISIPVDPVSGVGKLIKPGDRVDIIITVQVDSQNSVTKTLMQDVPILATGKNVTNNIARLIEKDPGSKIAKVRSLASDDRYGTVTIEVDPSQAQLVAYAVSSAKKGSIVLTLRNNDDTERNSLRPVSKSDMLGGDSKIINLQKRNTRKSRVVPFAR